MTRYQLSAYIALNPQSRDTTRAANAGFLMRDTRSAEALKYRPWYKLKLWAHKPTGLRWQCLVKALFTCQMPGCGWQAKASETHRLHADHIIPHRGVWRLFCDPNNLQCLCETCSNAAKQAYERSGIVAGADAAGRPKDATHPWNTGRG